MGQPKEGILLRDGRPMADHVHDAVASMGIPIAVLGSPTVWTPPEGTTILPDRQPGQGPLAGIDALLHWGRARVYIVVCCDQPLLTPEIMSFLEARASMATDRPLFLRTECGRDLDPFPGVYPVSLAPLVADALARGSRGMRRLFSSMADWHTVPDQWEHLTASMNDRESLRRAGLLPGN
ncbi:MAG: NTP transferase domain-containing protein [Candidatus Sumerlaeia bacterium]|nr:NTP transferase domain-containing protein [Candidatus Sumerlaeia bacterium]